MKKSIREIIARKYLFVPVIVNFLFLSAVNGAFINIGAGARPAGMGDAFTGISDDANAALYNPAGFSQLMNAHAQCAYYSILPGLDEDKVGYGFFSWCQPVTVNDVFGVSVSNLKGGLYCENTFVFSYARKILPFLSAGMNAKYLQETFTRNDYTAINPVFSNGVSAGGASFDAGVLFKPSGRLSLGISAQNINQPDLHISGSDLIPLDVRLGLGFKLNEKTLIALDGVSSKNINGDSRVIAGAETYLPGNFLLRGGLGTGKNSYNIISLGAGYRAGMLQLDYAFSYNPGNNLSGTYGNHKVSLSARFGRDISEKVSAGRDYDISVNTIREMPTAVYHLFKDRNISVVNIKLENRSDKEAGFEIFYSIGINKPTEKREVIVPAKDKKEINVVPALTRQEIKSVKTVPTPDEIYVQVFRSPSTTGEKPLLQNTYQVMLLPYDQFAPEVTDAKGETSSLLDTIVSWVAFNDRSLEKVITKAGEKGLKQDPPVKIIGFQPPEIFTMYRRDERTLDEKDKDYLAQIKLIYDILKDDFEVVYINQPVAYKRSQRINLPSKILENKGNCIELSVLFASLLESVEIEPILALFTDRGHSSAGWVVSDGKKTKCHLIETNVFGEDFSRVMEKGEELIKEYGLEREFEKGIVFDENGMYRKGSEVLILNVKKIRSRIPPSPYISD